LSHTGLSTPGSDKHGNPLGGVHWIFVLPDTHNLPTRTSQSCIRVAVAGAIRLYLCPPPFGIRLRPRCVFGTTVPEAAVDEHREPRPDEHYIRLPPRGGIGTDMYAVSKAEAVEARPQRSLWGGVA
jgi:hypothetical protein